jgi:hypothetical protein
MEEKERDEAGGEAKVNMNLAAVRGENDDKDEAEETARVMTLEACSTDDGSEGETLEVRERKKKKLTVRNQNWRLTYGTCNLVMVKKRRVEKKKIKRGRLYWKAGHEDILNEDENI